MYVCMYRLWLRFMYVCMYVYYKYDLVEQPYFLIYIYAILC